MPKRFGINTLSQKEYLQHFKTHKLKFYGFAHFKKLSVSRCECRFDIKKQKETFKINQLDADDEKAICKELSE